TLPAPMPPPTRSWASRGARARPGDSMRATSAAQARPCSAPFARPYRSGGGRGGAAGAFWGSHIRGEGATLLDAVREAIQIGREAGLPVQVSHIKAAGRRHWGGGAGAVGR